MHHRYQSSPHSAALFLLLLPCLLLLADTARAQDDLTGAFEGIVTDDQRKPIRGAAIEIKNKDDQRTSKVKAGWGGEVYYGRLKPGEDGSDGCGLHYLPRGVS